MDEYLTPRHRLLVQEKLQLFQGKITTPLTDIQQRVENEDISIRRLMDIGDHYTKENLPTAAIVWERLLTRVRGQKEWKDVMIRLFQVQLALGPWSSALETARVLFGDTAEAYPDLQNNFFGVYLTLGTAHRLHKDLDEAEKLYRRALCIARSLQDSDSEALAKIHLALVLLDRGQLSIAIDNFFKPLLSLKEKMTPFTRTLYLQHYGNACRSAADWGPAKMYLREALELAKEIKKPGLLSSCLGDLGNVFRSEGRYKDAELCHMKHYEIALRRGDLHGLAVACNNIGYLKYYNPDQYDESVIFQAIAYYMAEKVGDVSRVGMVLTKTGKLYTTLGHCEEAVKMFQSAIQCANQTGSVAREGMAWGDLGTVYRSLGRFDEAIKCHVIYCDNAAKRLDVGGVAIMQHQLAMDYFLKGDLHSAERSILASFRTLEKIRSQIGEEDESKISNFEKNQTEAHNLLQVLLVAQGKYKEAFVLADRSRARSLSEIVQKRLSGLKNEIGQIKKHPMHVPYDKAGPEELDLERIVEYFSKAVLISQKLATTLVTYSVVKEFDLAGKSETWVYIWVLTPSGELHFEKARLDVTLNTKVNVNGECIFSLRSSLGKKAEFQAALRSIQSRKCSTYKEVERPVMNLQNDEDIKGIEDIVFSKDIVLAEPVTEGNELNTGQWEIHTDNKSNYYSEISLKSDMDDFEETQERATGYTSCGVMSCTQTISMLQNPSSLPDPRVKTTSAGNPISSRVESASQKRSVTLSDLDVQIAAEREHVSPQDSVTQTEDYIPVPNAHAPFMKDCTGEQYVTAHTPVNSPNVGGDSNCPAESLVYVSQQGGKAGQEGPTKNTSPDNPVDSVEFVGPTSGHAEVVAKFEECTSNKEAGVSSQPHEDDNKECVTTGDAGTENWKPMLSSVYTFLIEPIQHLLSRESGDSRRVTFIPQDFLLRVPFAALREESGNSYLVENFVISTSPSIHLLDLTVDYLNNLQEGNGPEDVSLLAIGNPVMPFEELPSLPAAEQEVHMIAEILNCPRTEIALGSRATKNYVISVMSNFKILHFATHAAVDVSDAHGDFTHRGFIVLAKSDELCNGLLMAEEVKEMSLKAELVVLSCCDTGLGKVTGDGVLGLSRAFIAAGAACVVVTLWKIDDVSTSQLMKYFYKEYKNSRDAALAMHKAMRTLGESENTQSPEQWAAFSIIGATGPIR